MDTDRLLIELERESERRSRTLRNMLYAEGRPDLVAEFDKNMRDLRLGVTGARNAWHSITPAQRRVLSLLAEGRVLRREPWSRTRFGAYGPPADAAGVVCGLPTVRALCARELLACDGTATDPERKIVLTERGAFVVKSGTTTP